VSERDDYADPGPADYRRRSPLLTVALVFAVMLLVCLLIPPMLFLMSVLARNT